jgi:hypothetical protein
MYLGKKTDHNIPIASPAAAGYDSLELSSNTSASTGDFANPKFVQFLSVTNYVCLNRLLMCSYMNMPMNRNDQNTNVYAYGDLQYK